jgi:uncharacterized protein
MITLEHLIDKRQDILSLAKQYRTGNVRVFGSVVRGAATEDSDVDFLVRPEAGCSLFDLGGLVEELRMLIGCNVNVVPESDLKPSIREAVVREAVPL